MRGHRQGHGPEEAAREPTATARSDDGEGGVLRMFDHHPGGVTGSDRRRHGNGGFGDGGGGCLGDVLDGLLHGTVEVGGKTISAWLMLTPGTV